jgi:CRP-like cAMP-binding protein
MLARKDDAVMAMLIKLGRLASLDTDDTDAIAQLSFAPQKVKPGQFLVRQGSANQTCCLLIEGYACRHKVTSEGDRQIVSFHLRGDIVDLEQAFLRVADHHVQALTEAVIATVPAAELRSLVRERPAIGDALWRATFIDASVVREWVLNVGRRDAKSRIAHIICEFVARAEAVGLGSAEGFELPMTQEQLADAAGLTSVHVNRSLRALTEKGLIARTGRRMRIADWDRMCRFAGFDQAYLHAEAGRAWETGLSPQEQPAERWEHRVPGCDQRS